MISWEKRPIEIASLLNPAFCGEILRRCVKAYEDAAARPLPYSLIFFVLPIILHKNTRESLPISVKSQLHVWLQSHQEAKVGFAERMRQLVPVTREATTFLLQLDVFLISDDAGLSITSHKVRDVIGQTEGEIADCYKKARIIGQWLARVDNPATIYSMWGVKP